jgi:hypothetical protein
MAGTRSMLTRVRRLEQARAPTLSPFEAMAGGLDGWVADCAAGVAAGYLDRSDVPMIVLAVQRWHTDRVWSRAA